MLAGYRTYITLAVGLIYNVILPLIGVKDLTIDQIDMAVNTVLTIAAGVFRRIAKVR